MKNISSLSGIVAASLLGISHNAVAADFNIGTSLEPIANIQSQIVSGSKTSGDFGWNYQYEWEFIDQMMKISLDIALIGDDPGHLVNIWEEGIENTWGNTYDIIDGNFAYPLLFDVNFVNEDADQVVTIHAEAGHTNMTNWFLDLSSSWGEEYHDEIAAHEFGHMLGLYDEYEGGAVNPDVDNIFTDSLMADLRDTQPRHYEDILQLLIDETSRDLSLALATLSAPYKDEPTPNFVHTEAPLTETVPEPNITLALALLSLLMLSIKSKKTSCRI
ncbi:MAG: hypothetical protein WA865_14180 [Spirulinaceae cyanobacterium]